MQLNFFYDQNVESWGWNRSPSESRFSHFLRLFRSDYYENEEDHAMKDLCHCGTIKLSQKYKTNEKTYYFALTYGYKDNVSTRKQRDVSTLPTKAISNSLGYSEIDFDEKSNKKFERQK